MRERLHERWSEQVRNDPEAVAAIDAETGVAWSRSELAGAATAWREQIGKSVRGGDRVLVAQPNSLDWLAAFLALQEARAVPAALDSGEPQAVQISTAQAIGAKWLLSGDTLRELETGRFSRAGEACLIKLTSGTTGLPRALPFTHGQMLADGRQICSTMGIRPVDRNLALIPFGHSYGLGNLVVPLIAQGTPVVIVRSSLPHVLEQAIAAHGVTVFPAVPVVLRALIRAGVDPECLRSLRLVISAGAPLDAETAEGFRAKFGVSVQGFYGSSETGGICFDRTGAASLGARSVGTPLDGVSLVFRGGGRFSVISAAVKSPGRFSPADRGSLNEFGELVLLGRTGRTVKLAGRRVDLSEIERTLVSHPAITEAFVATHPTKADALAAAVVSSLGAADLRRYIRTRLAAWKVPDRLLVLPQFPVTARGKPDLRQLRSLLARPTPAGG